MVELKYIVGLLWFCSTLEVDKMTIREINDQSSGGANRVHRRIETNCSVFQ